MKVFSKSLRIAKCIAGFNAGVLYPLFLGIIVVSLIFPIYPEERRTFTYYIEWQNVVGAKGYLIQLKDKSNSTEKEERLNQNNVELKLPAGYYEYRIASVNKFGKPSVWTAWEEFHVEKDKPKPNPKDTKQAEVIKSEPKTSTPTEIKKWKWFIPGLTQYQANQKLYTSLWLIWFTGLAVYGNSERLAGNNLASDKLNDPKYLSILALGTPVSLDLYLWEKRNQAKEEYDQHQSNQAAAGAVAIVSYALQVWHSKRISEKNNVTVELNQRARAFGELRGVDAGNPLLSFELKISMRY